MLLLSKTNQDVYCFVSSSECFYTDKILIQGHVPGLWPPWHSSFTHCVLTEVCTSGMKKIKLFLHSHKFLHSWLRWMVPQKHKGPGKGDSDLFLFTVSPECTSQMCFYWNTGAGWRPSCYLASCCLKWSCQIHLAVPIGGAARLLSGQPSTDLGSAGKKTPNNFLL